VKKISMLIAVVSVLGAMAQSALAQSLVAFSGGIGDITTGSAGLWPRTPDHYPNGYARELP
jgi:hypothetical protein